MAAKKKPVWPRTVRYEQGAVRVALRADGRFALRWREDGAWRRTTASTEASALEWAGEKARKLAAGAGEQWIRAAQAESLESLRNIAGEGEGAVRRLLEDVRDARKWLAGRADLSTAARWYAEHGPLLVEQATVSVAVARFLAEYEESTETYRTFGTELKSFLAISGNGELRLLELDDARLKSWVERRTKTGDAPAPRTVVNRITTWTTFLNRARDWNLIGSKGKHAADMLRRPTVLDDEVESLSVDQGRALLAAVREHAPKLEAFLLIAGWCGLRPSEVRRLPWSAVDWERGYIHLTAAIAGKVKQARFVPVDPRVLARLRVLYQGRQNLKRDKIALARSREFLSVLARDKAVLSEWPNDGLRHSFCSYRLALLQDRARVAEEAGNSPKVIAESYRRPLREEDGAAWWALLD
jgi:integrase